MIMKEMIRKEACLLIILAVFAGVLWGASVCQAAAVVGAKEDYDKLPAFLETGLDPNLLLLIDNSASMYDPAYLDPIVEADGAVVSGGAGYCYADGYVSTTAYAGYFNPDIWYEYDTFPFCSNPDHDNETDCTAAPATWSTVSPDRFVEQSEIAAGNLCSASTYTIYSSDDLCVAVNTGPDPNEVKNFAAKGGFLNWLTSSKFDIEKEILTGGKYDATHKELVLETRGCLDKRFIKQADVYVDGDNTTTLYHATFGVRPPSDDDSNNEQASDEAYNGSSHNTRIEIFKVTTAGFDSSRCRDAINEFTEPDGGELGPRSTATLACMGGETNSRAAFNQAMQECWFFSQHGTWPTSVTAMKNACEGVYGFSGNSPFDPPTDPADYTDPNSIDPYGVCFGQYSPTIANRYGYVGSCWETFYSTGGTTCSDIPCDPNFETTFTIADDECASSPCCYDNGDNTGIWKICSGNYNSSQDTCNKPWVALQDCVSEEGGIVEKYGWTDDDYPTGTADEDGDGCILQALMDYCGTVDQPTIVDPSDNVAGSSSGAAIPAILVEWAAVGQLGEPLLVLKGRVKPPSDGDGLVIEPFGLVHEFKYNLRIGAMAFNDGTAEECARVQDNMGKWVANLYGCLADTGTEIDADSVKDPNKLDGGRIISYIDDGDDHTIALAQALNDVNATTWTPVAEAMFNAVGYFTQNPTSLRINAPTSDASVLKGGDFIRDTDSGLTLGPQYKSVEWDVGTAYIAGDIVWAGAAKNKMGYVKLYRAKNGGTSAYCATCSYIEEDDNITWMPYDPVLAGCQSNNILLITDGASTADIQGKATSSGLVDFVTNQANDDGDTAYTWTTAKTEPTEYECKDWIDTDEDGAYDADETMVDTHFGSTLFDDLTAYGHSGSSIYNHATIGSEDKQPIKTHIVVSGTLREDPLNLECSAKTIMTEAAENGGTTLLESSDPAALKRNLRAVFQAIGGEVSSGSAASVISHSRSGEGAIYQAIFYPKQVDAAMREVDWTGDVHSLWLDSTGKIREDCGDADRTATDVACPGPGDHILDPAKDYIIEFYTDASGSARARRFVDGDGNGSYNSTESACSNPAHMTEAACTAGSGVWNSDFVKGDILLKDLNYIWSAADWLAEASSAQRAYNSVVNDRYIFTMIPDASNVPKMYAFTTGALPTPLGGDTLYAAYFNAADPAEADKIVNYIRGAEQTGYRSREIDWTGDAATEVVKLGDIIQSTPTLVSAPAENYDLVYGDPTYRVFRKQYQNRRAVVYAGGNDGGLHAFNGGYYNRHTKEFLLRPDSSLIEYTLGAELWMYVPRNIFPHLRWLTEDDYGDAHNYYVDAKPYIFDAKIFNDDAIHPGGWGTVLVGGMRYGGGKIEVAGVGTMRSSYFILDITDPEVPPVVLAEFTDTSGDLGYTTGSPTAIPILRCDKNTLTGIAGCNTANWPMDWYLAFGSGPHSNAAGTAGPTAGMQGLSDQTGKVYVMRLGGTVAPATDTVGTGQTAIGTDPTFVAPPSLAATFTPGQCSDTSKPNVTTCVAASADWTTSLANSFFGDFIAVDYDLNFKTDTLYFGSVYDAVSNNHPTHGGALHRLVVNDNEDPDTWTLNTFYDVQSPVTAAPSVATDGERAWIFFGTGRLFSAKEDKAIATTIPPTQFLGLKERYGDSGLMDLYKPNGGLLVDATTVVVADGGVLTPNPIPLSTGTLDAAIDEFAELRVKMAELDTDATNDDKDLYHGWKIRLAPGERVIGQPAILGDIVTFTSYIPSNDPCTPEGISWLWAPYFQTGTAFYRSVIGTTAETGGDVLRKVSLGKGLATTPNIHTGAGDGSKAFVQSSTGAILSIEQTNPGVVKSGMRSWRELSGNSSCN
jgi:hypothetical protein